MWYLGLDFYLEGSIVLSTFVMMPLLFTQTREKMFRIYVEDQEVQIVIPEYVLAGGDDFFSKMDADMDQGWQMGPSWVAEPNQVQRCQIAADKLLAAIDMENETLLMLMAGYIVKKMPEVTGVRVNTDGEPTETEFLQ